MAVYAATVASKNRTVARIAPGVGMAYGSVDITNYNQTLAEITDITKLFKASSAPIVLAEGMSDNGYHVEWDMTNKAFKAFYPIAGSASASAGVITDNNDAATLGHGIYILPTSINAISVPQAFSAEASASGLIHDDDTAASTGVAVYVVVDEINFHPTYQLGHLEFVSPTDANGTCTVATGAETLTLYDDDDAAINGVVVRAVAAGAGLEATVGNTKDIVVATSSGKFIHINHATTGSTPTVYFDEDASNTYERLMAVVVDNADEPYKLFVNAAATEEASFAVEGPGTRLATLVTVGPKSFTYLVGASGPEISIASRPDVASLPGAMPVYVQAAGAGLNAANYGGEDLFIPASNGEFIKVAYTASPTGVLVYSYPEGATGDLALQGVIVDNADEAITTETGIGWKQQNVTATSGSEVANDVDIGVVNFVAFGTIN